MKEFKRKTVIIPLLAVLTIGIAIFHNDLDKLQAKESQDENIEVKASTENTTSTLENSNEKVMSTSESSSEKVMSTSESSSGEISSKLKAPLSRTRTGSVERPSMDGYKQITKSEQAEIPLADGKKLAYHFGPGNFIGYAASIYNADFNSGASPNVRLIDGKKTIDHMYLSASYGHFSTSSLLMAFPTSDTELTNQRVIEPVSATPGDIRWYKKIEENGMVSHRAIYQVGRGKVGLDVNNMKPKSLSNYTAGKFEVDIIMTGLPQGGVRNSYYVTNISKDLTIPNFFIGKYVDTELNGNDNVPIRAIGEKRGVYIQDQEYRLLYTFSNESLTMPVKSWAGMPYIMSKEYYRLGLPGGYLGTGQEVLDTPAGEAYIGENGDVDTSFSMKSAPQDFAPNETVGMDYQVSIVGNVGEPEITAPDVDYEDTPTITVPGRWADGMFGRVELEYSINGGEKTSIYTPYYLNDIPGAQVAFDVEVAAKDIDIWSDDNKIDFTMTNVSTGVVTTKTTKINIVKGEVEEIHKSNKGTILFEESHSKPLGQEFSFPQKEFPGYKYKSTTLKPEAEGVQWEGTYVKEKQTITHLYNAVEHELEIAVKDSNGVSAVTAKQGEILGFELLLKSRLTNSTGIYKQVNFEMTLPEKIIEATSATLELSNGTEVGKATITNNVLTTELTNMAINNDQNLIVRFKGKVAPSSVAGDKLDFSYKVKSTVTDPGIDIDLTSKTFTTTVTKGTLNFVSAPATIDFGGDNKLATQKTDYSVKELTGAPLIIEDNRPGEKSWMLKMKLEKDFKGENSNRSLTNILKYRKKTGDIAINSNDFEEVESKGTGNSSSVNISDTWSESNGPVLQLRAGQALAENYNATIIWSLEQAP